MELSLGLIGLGFDCSRHQRNQSNIDTYMYILDQKPSQNKSLGLEKVMRGTFISFACMISYLSLLISLAGLASISNYM